MKTPPKFRKIEIEEYVNERGQTKFYVEEVYEDGRRSGLYVLDSREQAEEVKQKLEKQKKK